MYVLGFCSLFDTQKEALPQSIILHVSSRIIPSLLLVFAGLKRAYDCKSSKYLTIDVAPCFVLRANRFFQSLFVLNNIKRQPNGDS
jgi:Na+-transporting NADH:ubiquinone oxidoreductase subunit NqrD